MSSPKRWVLSTLSQSKTKEEWKAEVKSTWKLSAPISLVSFLRFLLPVQTIMFLGRIGAEEMAGPALAFSVQNILGYAVADGLTTAVDTLCSQAFGAKRYPRLGHVLQRACLILLVFNGLLAVPLWYSGDLIAPLDTKPGVVEGCQTYNRITLWSLWPNFCFQAIGSYLFAQNITRPVMLISIGANVVCFVSNMVFVVHLDLAQTGAAWAMFITNWSVFFFSIVAIRVIHTTHSCWTGWSVDAFTGWGEFLKLGIPGAIMRAVEWWSFEVCLLVSATISTVGVDVMTIQMNLLGLLYMIPLGLSQGATVQVGNYLGAGKHKMAHFSAHVSIWMTVAWAVAPLALLLSLRENAAKIYTDDNDILSTFGHLIVQLSFFNVADAIQATYGGVLRGCGLQGYASAINIISFPLLGFWIALVLGVGEGQGLTGLWTGLAVGSLSQLTLGLIVYWNLRWPKIEEQVIQREKAALAEFERQRAQSMKRPLDVHEVQL